MSKVKLSSIGLVFLAVFLGACFFITLRKMVDRNVDAVDPDKCYIRLAHNVQEAGVQQGLDAVAKVYMERNPDVVIVQNVVPARVYRSWVNTMLIGGVAPDLMVNNTLFGETMMRYFVKFNEHIEKPNPYNSGTDLEQVRWRETFVDNLINRPAYLPMNLSYYGIPLTISTDRLLYNADMLEDLTGNRKPPPDFHSFFEMCRKIFDTSREKNETLVPIVGYGSQEAFIQNIYKSQTQKTALKLDSTRRLFFESDNLGVSYMKGVWSFENRDIIQGLELTREVASFLQPGFLQARFEDALFYFAQRKALMIVASSVEVQSILSQVDFDCGITEIPLPQPDDPDYGNNVLGSVSEAGSLTRFAFGLTRSSKNPEQALDFLQFLSSKEGNALFVRESGQLPAIVGVAPRAGLEPFMAKLDGYLNGFYPGRYWNATSRLFGSNFYLLQRDDNGLEEFIGIMKAKYGDAISRDLKTILSIRSDNVRSQDSWITALWVESRGSDITSGEPGQHSVLGEVLQVQAIQDETRYLMQETIRESESIAKEEAIN